MDSVGLTPWHWDLAGRVALAALLGSLFGLERDLHGHEAGLRTNMMIAISSCLFTILSISFFPSLSGIRDTARVAAQIVVGVGFLGGGTMIHAKNKVRGLTTAATIWLVAAIGMAVGAEAYFIAVFTSALALAILVFLAPISEWLSDYSKRRYLSRMQGRRKGPAGGDEDEERYWEEEIERRER